MFTSPPDSPSRQLYQEDANRPASVQDSHSMRDRNTAVAGAIGNDRVAEDAEGWPWLRLLVVSLQQWKDDADTADVNLADTAYLDTEYPTCPEIKGHRHCWTPKKDERRQGKSRVRKKPRCTVCGGVDLNDEGNANVEVLSALEMLRSCGFLEEWQFRHYIRRNIAQDILRRPLSVTKEIKKMDEDLQACLTARHKSEEKPRITVSKTWRFVTLLNDARRQEANHFSARDDNDLRNSGRMCLMECDDGRDARNFLTFQQQWARGEMPLEVLVAYADRWLTCGDDLKEAPTLNFSAIRNALSHLYTTRLISLEYYDSHKNAYQEEYSAVPSTGAGVPTCGAEGDNPYNANGTLPLVGD